MPKQVFFLIAEINGKIITEPQLRICEAENIDQAAEKLNIVVLEPYLNSPTDLVSVFIPWEQKKRLFHHLPTSRRERMEASLYLVSSEKLRELRESSIRIEKHVIVNKVLEHA